MTTSEGVQWAPDLIWHRAKVDELLGLLRALSDAPAGRYPSQADDIKTARYCLDAATFLLSAALCDGQRYVGAATHKMREHAAGQLSFALNRLLTPENVAGSGPVG